MHVQIPFSLNQELMKSANYFKWKPQSLTTLQQQSKKLI